MDIKGNLERTFIGIAFIWSYIFWAISIFIAVKGNVKMLENADLLAAILNNTLDSKLLTIAIINLIAGYGPMLAAIFITILDPETKEYFRNKFRIQTQLKYSIHVIALFLIITIIPTIPLLISRGFALNISVKWSLLGFLLLFFIYQFITAGTEEIGWRGYLLPVMLKKKTPWEASANIGIIWALWHAPIVLYLFYAQGLPFFQIILSYAGFIAGTIAMATVHTYYYLKTKNILFNMFTHAISNTIPMFIGMLIGSSFVISIVIQVLLWGFLILISKFDKDLLDTMQEQI
ncbi:MAG: CPBP family intramembrane glutamic endopeptidase [Gudongella sp.]|jgi:membrane protease YdiL (CAAX protease family)|nr:CPBP family intramembrane glutamic endopeptidase [Gudongella sp.]